MKRLLFVLVTLSIISCEKKEKPVDYAIFSGKIENSEGGKINVRNSEQDIKKIDVLEDGTFRDTIQNIEGGYYSFKYGNETSGIYLLPGYDLNMTIDTKQFDETVKYSGKGNIENNYLVQKFLNEEELGKVVSFPYLGSLDEKQYVHVVDSTKQLSLNFLNEQKEMDQNLKTLEEASITYGSALKLKQFEPVKRYFSKNKDFVKSNEFPDFESDLNLEDEDLLAVNNYKQYLSTYYSAIAAKKSKKNETDFAIEYIETVSNEVKSPKIKEFLLFQVASNTISYAKDLQKFYDLFMANSSSEDHKKVITEKYNKLIKLSKGQPSPKFVDYENYKGGTMSLDDLKGKYVYVDVWATWCGPCKREIPFLKTIEKEYHNKNIVFISMSIDKKKDYEKWKKMVKDESLSGVQLFAPNDWNSDFVTNYGITGIPRFILIDTEGNIVDSNAPRPSSPDLKKLFDELKI